MGTRSLTAVYRDGRYAVAQYCQLDGSPDLEGLTALRFARDDMDRSVFCAKLDRLEEVSDQELRERCASIGAGDDGWMTRNQSEEFWKRWPEIHRDTGAKVLSLVQGSPDGLGIRKEIEFAGASLFCEWAYVIDLDKNTFEAFKGFNKTPLGQDERFASISKEDDSKYFQIRLARTWSLESLPTDDEFVAALETGSEE